VRQRSSFREQLRRGNAHAATIWFTHSCRTKPNDSRPGDKAKSHFPGSQLEQDVTSQQENAMTLTFRCPAELHGLLPPPVPAALGLPDWFKAMPPQAFNAINDRVGDT
jgi:hypothetical protein